MTFSYSGDPSFSDIDALRFHTGDTVEANAFLTDEELQYVYDTQWPVTGHILGVAAFAAEMIAAKCTQMVSVSADGVQIDVGALQARFNDLAKSLRDQYRSQNVTGVMDAVEVDLTLDPLIPQLVFGIGFMDNPEAGQQDYGRQSVHYQSAAEQDTVW